jgi:hypothetical protein
MEAMKASKDGAEKSHHYYTKPCPPLLLLRQSTQNAATRGLAIPLPLKEERNMRLQSLIIFRL